MYTLTQAKDFVINQGYAICNDDTVEKLNEVFTYIKEYKIKFFGSLKYYSLNWCDDECLGNSINLSEIELPIKSVLIPANSLQAGDTLTIEMVIELTKKHTNDMELGSELRKLLNN